MVMGFPLVDSDGCGLNAGPFEKMLELFLGRELKLCDWHGLQLIAEG
jgi:hypothetical protein